MSENIYTAISDALLVAVLTLTGVFLTVKTKFVQIRCLRQGLKNTFSGVFSKEKTNGISPFASLAASLAAQLGTGNIVGAASAVLTGGPGAVFWMWVSAFFGMASSYSEAVLAQKTKIRLPDGSFSGGAPYYIREAFSGKAGKALAVIFSLFSMCALGFTGVSVQANSIAAAMKEALGVPVFISGTVLCISAGMILLKGTKGVVRLSERLIPVIAVLYTGVCIAVIVMNISSFPETLRLIFSCAFSVNALRGGITGITLGTVISQGFKRGLFTNEAGMGSTPCAHALSDAPSAHYQGTLGMTGVFIDTFVMMSITAIAVITVLYKNGSIPDASLSGSEAVGLTFSVLLGSRGASLFVTLSVLLFAFASILGWNLFGKASAVFVFGEKSERLYILSSAAFVFAGCLFPGQLIWSLTDIFNTFMVLTNVPALIKLSDTVKNEALSQKILK